MKHLFSHDSVLLCGLLTLINPVASAAEPSLIPMVEVPGGNFLMGVPKNSPNRDNDEWPQRMTTVGSFWMGKTPVTQAQWIAVMGGDSSHQKAGDLPVASVTWWEALVFCNRLSEKEGLRPVYRDYGPYGEEAASRLVFADPEADGYRLPTEAEWEFAARGGAMAKDEQGDTRNLDAVAWFRDNSGNRPHPVGQKAPNSLGLLDMQGNVLQWCWDGYEPEIYRGKKAVDPVRSGGNDRSARGSAWWNRAESLRVTKRNAFEAGNAFDFVGFRVARGPNPELAIKSDAEFQRRVLKASTTDLVARPGAPAVVPQIMKIPGPPSEPIKNPAAAEVRMLNGAPTLYVNGQPDTGLMLWRHAKNGEAEFADFRKAGINLIQPDLPVFWAWLPDGTMDQKRIDGIFAAILAGNPDARIMPRIHLRQPRWWRAAHPDRRVVGYQPGIDKYAVGGWDVNTFADEKWRTEMAGAAQELIRYVEERYGDHLIGYVIAAGDTGEWSPGWANGAEFDFSPAQTEAFRKWMNDPNVDIPRDRLGDGRKVFFNDPKADALVMKYFEFESEATADTVLYFAGKFRETLDSLKRKRILGAFYGYSYHMFFRMGGHDLNRVLRSPDIDFIVSLSTYKWRGPGGLYFGTTTPATLRVHGKLLYNEEDSATPLSKRVRPDSANRYGPPDWWTTRQLSVHKIVGSWIEGGTSWYMDWLNEDWYRDPGMLETISATQKLLKDQIGTDRRSAAEIAVFGSEKAVSFVRPSDQTLDHWRADQREPLARLGAPHDFYDIADLDEALKNENYKLLVFLEVPEIDPARLPKDVARLWTYLPGYSAEAASRSMGLAVVAGGPDPENPLFNPSAAPAENSGFEAFRPKLWRHGNTFWSPRAPVSLEDLRGVAAAAGVHFYAEPGDQILASKSLLMIHSAKEGKKILSLPTKSTVVDAYSGDVAAKDSDQFAVDLKLGETRVWKIEPATEP